jgi:hypothetical protein
MQTEAVLFFHLFHRVHSSAEATELGKFLLDSLWISIQPSFASESRT